VNLNQGAPNEADLLIKILEICEEQRSSVEDGFAPAIMQANRKLDVISANKSARKRVHEIWRNEKDRATIVSEKYLLGKLSEWTQKELGVAFGPPAVARQMTRSDISEEVANVVRAIEEGTDFPSFEKRSGLA
jgi:hypothetical protein